MATVDVALRPHAVGRVPRWAWLGGIAAAVALLYWLFRDTATLPHDDRHPAFEAVPAFDTAGAVRDVMASGALDAAAIAGARAARLYDAVVLASGIQDSDDNRTRFVKIVRAEKTGGRLV